MSGRGGNKDGRVAHAVAFLLRCQGAKVPEAMRAVKFTLKESLNTTKQMAVHHAHAKAIGGKQKSFPPLLLLKMKKSTTLTLMKMVTMRQDITEDDGVKENK